MQVPINVKSPNNISKWQMVFNLAFKGLIMNCIERKLYRVSIVISLLSVVWRARGPETKCFPNPAFLASGRAIIKQVLSLCAVIERASQVGCWD
jgi:hypothetical protein